MKSEVFTQVQAVLLDSQDDPEIEIIAALEGVASFALAELDLTESDFLSRAKSAYEIQKAQLHASG